MSQYFGKPFRSFGWNINSFKSCNKIRYQKYFTRWYFKFALKANLANLKTEVDNLDIDKLVPVPVDFSKLILISFKN